jgi:hypothetical protein
MRSSRSEMRVLTSRGGFGLTVLTESLYELSLLSMCHANLSYVEFRVKELLVAEAALPNT